MIYVITHKDFDDSFIKDSSYTVLHVGASSTFKDYLRDDVGNNISGKNYSYCELTGFYWFMNNGCEKKNDFIGLVHYRRYLSTFFKSFLWNFHLIDKIIPISQADINQLLNEYDIILPRKMLLWGGSIKSQFEACHGDKILPIVRNVIKDNYPKDIKIFDDTMMQDFAYICNVFVGKKYLIEQWYDYAFSVIDSIERDISIVYDAAPPDRIIGYVYERLFNVWINKQELKIKELPMLNPEGPRFFYQSIVPLMRSAYHLVKHG